MKYELNNLNLVTIFSDNGKHLIKVNELTSLFPNQIPSVVWQLDPLSPGIINYQTMGLEIVVVDNRLQIQSTAINGDIPFYFSDTLQTVLQAARERSIIAYGFNFHFTCSEMKEVKGLFNITVKTNSFIYQPNTFLRLTFKKNENLFLLEVSDGKPFSMLHINVHHDEKFLLADLAKDIHLKLKEDLENAKQLISEVFNIG
ncbi:hypothetical protein KVG29_08675 [Caldicoprobacter algeriensis]|uniref:hypothetical protein n=1 Tax=Caldicoprobacter algeriensis TaxID=699281 RepID=UPI00207A6CC4|nr:hypothetical protein [Caldicoprobacter algeriensis]MCM8901292.1 hypothetical protein [Caldicoprobacter algeriensis]